MTIHVIQHSIALVDAYLFMQFIFPSERSLNGAIYTDIHAITVIHWCVIDRVMSFQVDFLCTDRLALSICTTMQSCTFVLAHIRVNNSRETVAY